VATGPAAPQGASPSDAPVSGVPTVLDTATLVIQGATVRIGGVAGQGGEPAQDLTRYIRGRPVACAPIDALPGEYRCRIGEYDLAEAILLNGAARAARDAPDRLRYAEDQARRARRGIWRGE